MIGRWYKRFLRKNGMVGLVMTIISVVYILGILVQGTWGINPFNAMAASSISLPVHVPTFARHPWTLVTYWAYIPPLALWLVLVDLVLVYTFGNILNAMVGDRRTQGIIFFAILWNAVVTITLVNLLPTVNASPDASIFGFHSINATLIAACMTLVPRYNFRIIRYDVPLWVIGSVILFIMIGGYRGPQTTMGTSMMVGALVGFIWIKVLQTGTDLTSWLHFDIGFDTQNPQRQAQVPISDMSRIKVLTSRNRREERRQEREDNKPSPADRLDELLDKINDVGYDRLTTKEKEELKRLSSH